MELVSNMTGVFDHMSERDYSLGFMELIGVDSFTGASSPFLNAVFSTPEPGACRIESPDGSNKLLLPASRGEDGEQKEGQQKAKKVQLKVMKKTNEKRQKQREARFAFMTKSEVDHLEDGYRWRKYGQKAVKHSTFPRSYYRCTSGSCNVKKRVERSFRDPSVVVTTYEGKHTHPSPLNVMPPDHHRDPSHLAGGGNYYDQLINGVGAAANIGMQMQMMNPEAAPFLNTDHHYHLKDYNFPNSSSAGIFLQER